MMEKKSERCGHKSNMKFESEWLLNRCIWIGFNHDNANGKYLWLQWKQIKGTTIFFFLLPFFNQLYLTNTICIIQALPYQHIYLQLWKNEIQFENRALQVHLQLIENTTAVIHKHISDRKHIHNMFDNTAIAATNNDFSTFGGQMCERSIKIHEIVLTWIVFFFSFFHLICSIC